MEILNIIQILSISDQKNNRIRNRKIEYTINEPDNNASNKQEGQPEQRREQILIYNPIEKVKTFISKNRKDVVFGYLRECQYLLPTDQSYYQISAIVQRTILLFYGEHKQVIILQDDDLRKRSVALVTGDNNEFIKFFEKILKSKLNEKIWNKCDPNNSGKIETEKFMYFWTLPVTLFKVGLYRRKHGNKDKPKLDQKELKKEFTHLATWIIRKYGEKQLDGGATLVLTKESFAKDIVEYVKKYADAKGELYEDY